MIEREEKFIDTLLGQIHQEWWSEWNPLVSLSELCTVDYSTICQIFCDILQRFENTAFCLVHIISITLHFENTASLCDHHHCQRHPTFFENTRYHREHSISRTLACIEYTGAAFREHRIHYPRDWPKPRAHRY